MRIAREQLAQIRRLNHSINQLRLELAELVTAHRPKLLAGQGCGVLTAAILIGHTAGNERFRSDASFALQTGTAPIPCSSGQRTQHRLNRGGDRQLNHALHIIAVTRAQRDPATKGVPSAQGSRRQDHQGGSALPQAPPRPPLLPPPRRAAADQQHAVESQPIIEPQAMAPNGKPTTIPKRREPHPGTILVKGGPRSCPA